MSSPPPAAVWNVITATNGRNTSGIATDSRKFGITYQPSAPKRRLNIIRRCLCIACSVP